VPLPRTTCRRSKRRHQVGPWAAVEGGAGAGAAANTAGMVATVVTTVVEVVTAAMVVGAHAATVEAGRRRPSASLGVDGVLHVGLADLFGAKEPVLGQR